MDSANEFPDLDLAALFRAHSAGLSGAVRAVLGPAGDVQEVLQEAFLRAWKARTEGARPAEPVAWVFVVTLNLARDLRRQRGRRGREKEWDEVEASLSTAGDTEPARSLERDEALAAARRAIARLDEREKEVFLLRVSGELSFTAIAGVLGIPVGTAKTRMRAALRALRSHLRAFAPLADTDLRGRAG